MAIRDPEDLLECRLAIGHLIQRILSKCSHALLAAQIPELCDGRTAGDSIAKDITNLKHFIDS